MGAAPRIEFRLPVHDDTANLPLVLETRLLCGEAVPDKLRSEQLVRHHPEIVGDARRADEIFVGSSDTAGDLGCSPDRKLVTSGGWRVSIHDASDMEVLVGLLVKIILVRLEQRWRQPDCVARTAAPIGLPLWTVVAVPADAEEVELEWPGELVHLQHVEHTFGEVLGKEVVTPSDLLQNTDRDPSAYSNSVLSSCCSWLKHHIRWLASMLRSAVTSV